MSRRRRTKRNPPLVGLAVVAAAGIAAYYWWKNRKAGSVPRMAVISNADGSVDRVLAAPPEFVPTPNQYPSPIGPTPDGGFLN